MSSTPGDLTSTLILALSQSQENTKTIREQAARIARLESENERLRKELSSFNEELENGVAQQGPTFAEQNKHAEELQDDQPSSQVDDLFQRNVDAQAEISKLRKRLKHYKEKANLRLSVPISSPLSCQTSPLPSSPHDQPPVGPGAKNLHEATSPSPPRKRAKLDHLEVLKEISGNKSHSRTSSSASKKSIVEKKIAAIPFLAEDGEVHAPAQVPITAATDQLHRQTSASRRLDGLLAAPTTSRAPLNRPAGANSPGQTTPASIRKSLKISNIEHVASGVLPPNSPRQRSSLQKPQVLGPTRARSPERSPVRSEKLPPLRTFKRGHDDGAPLRSQALTMLSLQDFKPNPRWLDSHGMSYDEFLHGSNAERVKALAETLPKLPGYGTGKEMTEDELLLDFLGPGSENKIALLTQVARANLLAEAKVKRTVQLFGKQRVDYDREQDPPGFWSADMPGTQENEGNRKIAQELERLEVRKRYDDAMSGQGRWIFADE